MTVAFDIAQLKNNLPSKIDAYICCASFEDRSRVLGEAVPLDRVNKAIIFVNREFLKFSELNLNLLLKKFDPVGSSAEISANNPMLTADVIQAAAKNIFRENPKTIIIDISTFTHESLLILFKVISALKREGDRIYFLYLGASEYSIGLAHDQKWLSQGILSIRSVLGYAGELLPTKKNHLIIIVGYEQERASKLIEAFEPNKISLGYGIAGSSTSEKNHEANKFFHNLLAKTGSVYSQVNEFLLSSNDPTIAMEDIIKCIDNNTEYNSILVPMNTKLSTIACALTAAYRPAVQLCYAQALQYNYLNYSRAGNKCYLLEFDSIFKQKMR